MLIGRMREITTARPATNNKAAAADRGYGQKPQTSNASATGGYKQGGNARADANRGKQSMGGGGGGHGRLQHVQLRRQLRKVAGRARSKRLRLVKLAFGI